MQDAAGTDRTGCLISMNPVDDLENIYRQAIAEVDPAGLVCSRVRKDERTLLISGQDTVFSEDLSGYQQIIVLGVGKASARMASAMESILADDLSQGVIITKYGYGLPLRKIQVIEAGHPVPDENSLKGAQVITQLAEAAKEDTLIINLVSGGGSSLSCLPAGDISLQDKQQTTRALLACGANIDEMNCVRKHLSGIKGGGLAVAAFPAKLVTLILSDVIGDRLDTIASGITVFDPTTFQDALSIVLKYRLEDSLPQSVLRHFSLGSHGDIPETPKADHPAFLNTVNILLGNNTLACNAAYRTAKTLGYDTRILSTTLTGEAAEAGICFAKLACEITAGKTGRSKPVAVIAGGETTVTLRGKGKGGRNQELALAFANKLHRISPDARNIFFLSAGTDGSDGPTDAAGAFVTPGLMEKMKDIADRAQDSLAKNDTYSFFHDTDSLFKTGPTYTNVCDIQILIVT